jgi:hypothetical protein
MSRLTFLKNRSDEAFNTSSACFIALSLSTLYEFLKKSPLNSEGLSNTYVKGKMTKFLAFAKEIYDLY